MCRNGETNSLGWSVFQCFFLLILLFYIASVFIIVLKRHVQCTERHVHDEDKRFNRETMLLSYMSVFFCVGHLLV